MKTKGLALIAVIVMIVLFSSLILAVVLSATISIRRANYYKDKLIAFEIAEAGIQEILYRMNYYGYQENNSGIDWTRASWLGNNFQNSIISIPNWYKTLISSKGLTESDLTKYETEILFSEYSKKAKSTIYFIDANSTTNPETDLDLIIAKGIHNGRTTTISFLLRGTGEIREYSSNFYYGDFSQKNTNRTKGSCGVPEVFNKKVIYANNISLPSSSSNYQIIGNITTSTQKPNPYPSQLSKATWIETEITLDNLPRFETTISTFNISQMPSTSTYYARYSNNGRVHIPPTNPSGTPVNNQNDGVYWQASTKTYYFGTDDGSTPSNFTSQGNTLVEAQAEIPNYAGNVTITHYFKVEGSTTPNIPGNLTINKDITTTTNSSNFCIDVKDSLTIASGITINGDLVVKNQPLNLNNNTINGKILCDNNITINGGTIQKDVISTTSDVYVSGGTIYENIYASGDISITNTAVDRNVFSKGNVAINGGRVGGVLIYSDVSKNHTITIQGSPKIDSRDSDLDSALYIYNTLSTGNANINLNSGSSLSIILGEKQKAGIVVYFPNGIGNINIQSPFTIKYYNPNNPPSPSDYPFNQFTIVNYSGNGGVNITANNLTLNGSIYSYKNISFNNNTQNLTGTLIAGGTLTIGNNTFIKYYSEPFKNNSEVYKGFVGGSRRYIPVIGSWRIEW